MSTVHGCRDLQPIYGAVVFRTEHSAVVFCNDTQDTWYVTCGRDGHWIGDVINCTRSTSGMSQSSLSRSSRDNKYCFSVVLRVKWNQLLTSNELECGPMPNVMAVAALSNIGGDLCSTPQRLVYAHY